MSNILTPLAIWKNFDSSLTLMHRSLGEKIEDGIRYERVSFAGRDTGEGRVTIFGVLASTAAAPSLDGVLILGDSRQPIREDLLKLFVEKGYTVLQVDYAGEREGAEEYTRYPSVVSYANDAQSSRYKQYVDESADKTAWYEWTAVGIYARKYLAARLGNDNIGLVGIRDGGEIAWKLAVAEKFACAVVVSACGWKAYEGYGKFSNAEPPQFDDERYRFVAGIDSQAYAPYIRCPVLMLCTTNDYAFDYDRAYDTFSRINPDYQGQSAITYSVNCDCRIDNRSTKDMFMYLDGFVKGRQVFIPKPVDISVVVDEESNLVIRAECDEKGVLEECGVYVAEDCVESALRSWAKIPFKRNLGENCREFFMNLYENTKLLFVLGYAVYSNGFTMWSKLAVKKVSGKFRNSRTKSKILYSVRGSNSFGAADLSSLAVGGMFMTDSDYEPTIITENGLKGIYSPYGLFTTRSYSPQFAPDGDSILRFDICPEEDGICKVYLVSGEKAVCYSAIIRLVGGVWQKIVLESKFFKNSEGIALENFDGCRTITVICDKKYALNNLIWL